MADVTTNYGPNAGGVVYSLTAHKLLGATTSYTLKVYENGKLTDTVNGIPPGNVLTKNGDALSVITLPLTTNVFVVPPGVTGSVDVGVALLGTTDIYVGGSATISTAVQVASGLNVNVQGGTATAAAGTVAGALGGMTVNLSDGGTFTNGGAVLTAISGTTINFGTNGGTFIENAGGAVITLFSGQHINGFDAAVDKIEFQNLPGQVTSYTITSTKPLIGTGYQTITLKDAAGKNVAEVNVNYVNNKPVLTTGTFTSGMSGPLKIAESGSGSHWNVTIDPEPSIVPCFYAGTLIATPEGEIAVEDIRAGTVLRLADGREAAVRWVGHSAVSTRFADPLRVLPIRIKAGALGENLPARDLLLSPDHAVFMDGILVNAGALVNGTSIIRDESVPETFTYYHVELAGHELLLAEGVPSETFLDNIDRLNFHNWDARTAPNEAIAEMDHPRAKSHRQVPHAIRAALAARAAQMQGVEVEAA